jgi:hypothetical protein
VPIPRTVVRRTSSICSRAARQADPGGLAYCAISTDPDAVFGDGSGCSCGWNSYWDKAAAGTSKACAPGSCRGKCHDDPNLPCVMDAGGAGVVCYGKVGGSCPAGTKPCDYK